MIFTDPTSPLVFIRQLDVPSSFLGLLPGNPEIAIVCSCWGYCGGSKRAGEIYAEAAGKRVSHGACPVCEKGMMAEVMKL